MCFICCPRDPRFVDWNLSISLVESVRIVEKGSGCDAARVSNSVRVQGHSRPDPLCDEGDVFIVDHRLTVALGIIFVENSPFKLVRRHRFHVPSVILVEILKLLLHHQAIRCLIVWRSIYMYTDYYDLNIPTEYLSGALQNGKYTVSW